MAAETTRTASSQVSVRGGGLRVQSAPGPLFEKEPSLRPSPSESSTAGDPLSSLDQADTGIIWPGPGVGEVKQNAFCLAVAPSPAESCWPGPGGSCRGCRDCD